VDKKSYLKKKLILGHICLFIGIILGLIIATQTLVKILGYHEIFGQPLFKISAYSVYPFWKYPYWYYYYANHLPKAFNMANTGIIIGFALGVGLAVIGRFYINKRYYSDTHGTADWASMEDIEKTGLLEEDGVILGMDKTGKNFLRHNGPEHVICFAPTRSGKGVGVIIPTLLTWFHSVVITDIKGENWAITAGYRKNCLKNKTIKFDPIKVSEDATASASFNPLKEIRLRTMTEVRDVQNIVSILVDPDGKGDGGPDAHWKQSAAVLLTACIIHLLYVDAETSLNDLVTFISSPERPLKETDESEGTLNFMINYKHEILNKEELIKKHGKDSLLLSEIYINQIAGNKTHPIVAESAREMLNKSDNELSGVVSTAVTLLSLYRDPLVARYTAKSDFTISDLMNHSHPVSLYLCVPPSDITRLKPLTRMIINLIICRLTEKMDFKDGQPIKSYKHRLLLLMDEFPALGKLELFEQSMAYIAGYGMKALLIIQDLAQLTKAYKADNAILGNCHIRMAYTPNDIKTAEYISKLLGTRTVVLESKSYNNGNIFTRESTSMQEVKRDLLTPSEVTQIPANVEIVFIAGHPPIWGKKIKHWKEPIFKKRLQDPPKQSDKIKLVKKKEDVKSSALPIKQTVKIEKQTEKTIIEETNTEQLKGDETETQTTTNFPKKVFTPIIYEPTGISAIIENHDANNTIEITHDEENEENCEYEENDEV
jgi:type IV secretion system protein VirD4